MSLSDIKTEQIDTLSAKETVGVLRECGIRISEPTLYRGIASGQFPFGVCIRSEDGNHVSNCIIFRSDLERWIAEKSGA